MFAAAGTTPTRGRAGYRSVTARSMIPRRDGKEAYEHLAWGTTTRNAPGRARGVERSALPGDKADLYAVRRAHGPMRGRRDPGR